MVSCQPVTIVNWLVEIVVASFEQDCSTRIGIQREDLSGDYSL